MSRRAFVSRFSPNRTDPQLLEAIFVQRHHMAEVWLERLRDSVLTGTRHHLLAVGPRGSGKSHLVNLLLHRLRRDPTVIERVRIAWLPEDETTPSYWKFLLRILRALQTEYGDEFPPPPHGELAEAKEAHRITLLTDYLLQKLDGHILLVVVENLDDVMHGLKPEGQKRWRAFIQEHRVAATLATAQQLTRDFSAREKPFFNFFQIERLQPLSADEALTLLEKLAAQNENTRLVEFLRLPVGRARVRAIRHLTGGSHRVFIILSEFATRENLDDLVSVFEELLDELTPYYQERLRWLPDQQREIVEFLCRQTRTVQVKEIAAALFLNEPTTAAQLKVLRDKGYVISATVGRESRYELAEPLMRLCVEVKDPQREPIRLIVDFLRVWYDQSVVEARLECLPPHAHLERSYFLAVLQAHDGAESDPLQEALNRDLAAARAADDPEEIVRVLCDLGATAPEAATCTRAGDELFRLGRYSEANLAYQRALEFDHCQSITWNNKGAALSYTGRLPEALEAYERALQLDASNYWVWGNKGGALHHLGRYAEALEAYDHALELAPDTSILWRWKGTTLTWLGRNEEALSALRRALALDSEAAITWVEAASCLNRLDRELEALTSCERALKLDPDNIRAWSERGLTLARLKRYEESLTALNYAIQLASEDSHSLATRGYVRLALGQIDGAVKDLSTAVGRLKNCAWALDALAEAYLLQYTWDRAELTLLQRLRLPEADADTVPPLSPRLLASIFRTATDPGEHRKRVESLTQIIHEAGEQRAPEQTAPTPDDPPTTDTEAPRLMAMLGNALVHSLDDEAYSRASAEAIAGWVDAWRDAAQQHPELSLPVRLFSVGLRYVRSKDERVLLDLVQEERAMLCDLFGLDADDTAGQGDAD